MSGALTPFTLLVFVPFAVPKLDFFVEDLASSPDPFVKCSTFAATICSLRLFFWGFEGLEDCEDKENTSAETDSDEDEETPLIFSDWRCAPADGVCVGVLNVAVDLDGAEAS